MQKPALRWIINALVLITLVIIVFLPEDKEQPIWWQPYTIFALANWLFADLIFRYTPPALNIKSKKIPLQYLLDIIYATIITAIVFNYSSRYLFDDAGFVLRYVENFKQGYFYHYNPGDPAVFGLSGFIYGCAVSIQERVRK